MITFSYRAYLVDCAVKDPSTVYGKDLDGKLRF